MTIQSTDSTSPVCYKCLEDSFLKARVKSEGRVDNCHFCGTRAMSVTIEMLSEWVAEVLDEHFRLGPTFPISDEDDHTYYEQEGEDLNFIVSEIIDADPEVVDAIIKELTALTYIIVKDGGEPRFDRDANYIKKRPNIYEIDDEWNQIRQQLKHRARFFNADARNFFDRLMKDIRTLRSFGASKEAVIREIKPNRSKSFYRARRADKPDKLKRILKKPKKELGPPPPAFAIPSRMNAEGISVFYGSFDRKTCIAELRPSIGSTLVTAEFRLQKPIRILDFQLLEKCYHESPLSYFQPDFNQKNINRLFLRRLHSKIRHPILPGDESEYLITQVLSEYLRTFVHPPLDGILFSSGQWEGGLNVVLFNDALDIQLDGRRGIIMGPKSALTFCDGSVLVHRIKRIDYGFQDYKVRKGRVEWPPHEDELLDDYD